jgi:predicted permease
MRGSDFLLRLRALLGLRRAERELDEELSFHLEMEARKKRTSGVPEARARELAHAEFGGVEQVREECREVRGVLPIENLARDLRYGLRILRKTPVFTVIAVLSLAIGIGANTAIFSLLDTILLRMLPVRNPEQLVVARWGTHKGLDDLHFDWATGGGDGTGFSTRNVVSLPIYADMRARSRALTDVMGFSPLGPVNVAVNGKALSAGGMVVTGNYFSGLGVGALIGRPITDDDDTSDGLPSAVLSYRFWERAFGLDPTAIGKTIYVNGHPCVISGVTPQEFYGVSLGGFMLTPEVDVTVPLRAKKRIESSGRDRDAWFADDVFWIQVMGRLKPGSTEPAAAAELATILAANLPESARRKMGRELPRVLLDPGGQGLDTLRLTYRKPLLILMVVVALTLLMACANLAGLLLARATARQREILLRLALGASRARLVRQLLVEGALISAAGTAAGLALAYWGVRSLLALVATGSEPIPVGLSLDLRVFGFTAAVALLTTFLFALAPALRATRVDVSSGVKKSGGWGVSRILVTVQVAVALVLLAGATLFTRSLANLRSTPLGFNAHNVVLFDVAPGKSGYDETRGNLVYARVLERLKQTPGVIGASMSSSRLISGYVSNGGILIEGQTSKDAVDSTFNFVGPQFFEVMGIPMVMGRSLDWRDMSAVPRVAVINESLARRSFGAGSPIGKRFRWDFKNEWDVEVVGVVKDARYDRLRSKPPDTIYTPYTQNPFGWRDAMSFEVRIVGPTASATAGIRRAVADVDPMLPLTEMKTQEDQIDGTLTQERMFASLVSLFGVITLVLACVGLYGLVAYSVTSRTREIGVRMALGADRYRVLRLLLGQVTMCILAGLAVGLPLTWALTRVIQSQFYGIQAHDPASLVLASGAVAIVALLAAFLPARRAMRIDPINALRYE